MDVPQSHVVLSLFICEGCIEGNQKLLPFPVDGATRATKQLGLVHFHVYGPMKKTSIGKTKYFVTFIDDFLRKIWVYLIKANTECFEKIKESKALVENQCQKKVKVLHTDNGSEFMSNQFREFLKKRGIARRTSNPCTPQ